MGRSPCCDKAVGLKKGTWTAEEDQKLLTYIERHGHGSWRALPAKAGLQRCGKSCRLRWTNYLRPDIKRGKFSLQEEQTIIQLHALLGNRWSAIAAHLPKRTDNEIKNYWNTHLKKRLIKMGIDPSTHKPRTNAFGCASSQPNVAANLNHMAQWESARLEAEARLVRESKLISINPSPTKPSFRPPCLDILKVWQATWAATKNINNPSSTTIGLYKGSLQSPTSILNFSDNIWTMPRSTSSATFDNAAFSTGPGTMSTTKEIDDRPSRKPNHDNVAQKMEMIEMNNAMQLDHDHGHDGIELPNPVDAAGYISNIIAEDSYLRHHMSLMDGTLAGILSDDGNDSASPTGAGAYSCGGDQDLDDNRKYWNDIFDNVANFASAGSPIF